MESHHCYSHGIKHASCFNAQPMKQKLCLTLATSMPPECTFSKSIQLYSKIHVMFTLIVHYPAAISLYNHHISQTPRVNPTTPSQEPNTVPLRCILAAGSGPCSGRRHPSSPIHLNFVNHGSVRGGGGGGGGGGVLFFGSVLSAKGPRTGARIRL